MLDLVRQEFVQLEYTEYLDYLDDVQFIDENTITTKNHTVHIHEDATVMIDHSIALSDWFTGRHPEYNNIIPILLYITYFGSDRFARVFEQQPGIVATLKAFSIFYNLSIY